MKCTLWTETLEFWRLKVHNLRFALHGLPSLVHGLCAIRASNSRFLLILLASLDTCHDSPILCQPLRAFEKSKTKARWRHGRLSSWVHHTYLHTSAGTPCRATCVALHVSQQISSESWGFSGVAAVSRYTPLKRPCRTCRPSTARGVARQADSDKVSRYRGV